MKIPKKVAIAGFGAIGKVLARRLTDGSMPDFELAVIGARDPVRTQAIAAATIAALMRLSRLKYCAANMRPSA